MSQEELRAEARRLREAAKDVSDPATKQELAERALQLSLRAEEFERSREAPEILNANIKRYRAMLAAGIKDGQQKRIVEEMLLDAEKLLAQARVKP